MKHRLCRTLVSGVIALGSIAIPIAAQAQDSSSSSSQSRANRSQRFTDTARWDIEFHKGFGSFEPARGGSGSLPSAGATFTTVGGSPTRHVTSWYFGDGAELLNGVLASFGRPERITPLDGMLTIGATNHDVLAGAGVRVTHVLTPRLAVEGALEVGSATFTVTDEARSLLEATSDSFPGAFGGIVAAGQGVAFQNPAITSSFSTADGSGRELVVTGAIVYGPQHTGRFRPYVVAGGGFARASGEATASLHGNYRFNLPSGALVNETDRVNIRFAGGTGLVVLAGAGLSVHLTRGSGVRADARLHLVQNHVNTYVDTTPSVAASQPADAIWSDLTPGIQFSTNPSTGVESSLSAPPLDAFRTLKGSGFQNRLTLAIGYFVRF